MAYTAAWNAILKNLQSATPDLHLAKWVVEQFEDANLAKLEIVLATQEREVASGPTDRLLSTVPTLEEQDAAKDKAPFVSVSEFATSSDYFNFP